MPAWATDGSSLDIDHTKNCVTANERTIRFPAVASWNDIIKKGNGSWTFTILSNPKEGMIIGVTNRSHIRPGKSMRMLGLATSGELHNGVDPANCEVYLDRPLEDGDKVTVSIIIEGNTALVWFALNDKLKPCAFECISKDISQEGLMPIVDFWGKGSVSIVKNERKFTPPIEDAWQLVAIGADDAPKDFPVLLTLERAQGPVKYNEQPLLAATIATGPRKAYWTGNEDSPDLALYIKQSIKTYEDEKKKGLTARPVRRIGGRYAMR